MLNMILPNCSVKFFKNNYLPDLLRHSQSLASGSDTNLQVKTQAFFISHSIELINEHLTYQDEDLALSLMNMIDVFKCSEFEEISEAAFDVDNRIKYNIGKADDMKTKRYQRIEIIKHQREKRLLVREQFELEHEDA